MRYGWTDRTGRLWSAWRSASDEIWATWDEVLAAPVTARASAYDQHLRALDDERLAADELAADCWAQTADLHQAA
jgi:hypothetical protein